MDELQELLTTFSREVAEYLDTLGAAIESLSDFTERELADNIQTILRIAHTIKGGAACVGEESLAETAHQLEDVLSPFRRSDQRPPQEVQDSCLELLDVLRHQSEKIGQGSVSGDIDLEKATRTATNGV